MENMHSIDKRHWPGRLHEFVEPGGLLLAASQESEGARSKNHSRRRFALLLLGLVVTMAASFSRRGGEQLVAAEASVPPAAIGVYDSRVIAYAYFWSAPYQRKIADLTQTAKAAQAAGQTERFNELTATLQKEQERNHLQVFSTAPVDEALAEMKDRLPAIQKEAGVTKLVSKWDEKALKEDKRARQVEVTDLLLREFKLDEKKMKVAQDIRKTKPLPLDEAQKLMRQGKL